jgi:hypothetical protein
MGPPPWSVCLIRDERGGVLELLEK